MTPLLRFVTLLRRVFRCETPFRTPAPKQVFVETGWQCLQVLRGVYVIRITCHNPNGSVTEFVDPDMSAESWVMLRINPATGRYEWQADADDERSWED